VCVCVEGGKHQPAAVDVVAGASALPQCVFGAVLEPPQHLHTSAYVSIGHVSAPASVSMRQHSESVSALSHGSTRPPDTLLHSRPRTLCMFFFNFFYMFFMFFKYMYACA